MLVNRDSFSSVDELTSWDLFNYFADNLDPGGDGSKWYNPDDHHCHFPAEEITRFLDQHFEGYNFNPNAISFEEGYYDENEDAVVVPSYGAHSYNNFEVEDIRATSSDKVEIDTVYYDWIEDPELTEILYRKRMTLKITNDGYRYISYEMLPN